MWDTLLPGITSDAMYPSTSCQMTVEPWQPTCHPTSNTDSVDVRAQHVDSASFFGEPSTASDTPYGAAISTASLGDSRLGSEFRNPTMAVLPGFVAGMGNKTNQGACSSALRESPSWRIER